MPRVPVYTRQVDTAPAPKPTRQGYATVQLETPPPRVTPSAAALGAGFGQTVATIGQEIWARETARQDQVRIQQAERKLSDWEIERVYHPEKGALQVQGEQVYGLEQKLGEDYDKTSSEISGSLNERQRMRFEPISQARRASVMTRVNQHVAVESRRIDAEEMKRAVENETNITIANNANPERVRLGIDNVERRIGLYAQRNGWGPEQTKREIDRAVSDIHVGVINRFLDQGLDIQANVYYEHAQREIDGSQLGSIEKKLEDGSLTGESQRHFDGIMQKGLPHKEAVEEARKISDPKLRDLVEARVDREYAQLKQWENERRLQASAQAKATLDQLMADMLNQIDRKKPIFARDVVPANVWALLGAEDRGALETYAKRYQETNGAIKTDQSHWYTLLRQASQDPKAFADRNLMLSAPKLSVSDFQELAKLQKSVRDANEKEVDKALDDFRSETQVINNTLSTLGINPGLNENDATVARVHQMVGERAGALERLTGKKPTNDDLQRIVDDIVKSSYTVKGWIWDAQKPLVAVTIADIPAKDRRQIEEALRSKNQVVTDETILDLFIRTQQRLKK